MLWGSPLLVEFKRLGSSSSAHRRGLKLESLLERLFQQGHFRVKRNAGVAKPRQTDLVARYGDIWYLIEAKWQNTPADVSVFDAVRARMDRTASSSVVGVIISVSGFTEDAMEDLHHRRDRWPILLFGEEELTQVLSKPRYLANLLRLKREELITHGRVHLAASSRPPRRRRLSKDVPASDLRLVGTDLKPLSRITTGGGFGDFVFVQELPDVDWAAGSGSGVSLDLLIKPFDENGIADFLYELDSTGWTSSEPRWNIQQATTNWHGVGAREFLDTLRAWKKRYEGLDSEHHTEQVTYFDTCQGGGFYTLTGGVASHDSRSASHWNVSFQLPGVPVDLQPIRHLFEEFDAAAFSYFRPLATRAVTRHRPEADIPLEAVAYIVSSNDLEPDPLSDEHEMPPDWVTGIVVKNPHLMGNGTSAPEGWPGQVYASEHLICDLRSHHPLNASKDAYYLFSWEYAHTTDALAFRPVADW
ncbi:restriction endonuclease [Streptomyces microflavus]|uniref:restriction endonuclease n=1 Tax=Streptomyces microflavus TaxID=1919 RepID=UPI003648FFF5